jgi:hypothetical protein
LGSGRLGLELGMVDLGLDVDRGFGGLGTLDDLDKTRANGGHHLFWKVLGANSLGHFHRYGVGGHIHIYTLAPRIVDHALVVQLQLLSQVVDSYLLVLHCHI